MEDELVEAGTWWIPLDTIFPISFVDLGVFGLTLFGDFSRGSFDARRFPS